jgi:hypothetical protein
MSTRKISSSEKKKKNTFSSIFRGTLKRLGWKRKTPDPIDELKNLPVPDKDPKKVIEENEKVIQASLQRLKDAVKQEQKSDKIWEKAVKKIETLEKQKHSQSLKNRKELKEQEKLIEQLERLKLNSTVKLRTRKGVLDKLHNLPPAPHPTTIPSIQVVKIPSPAPVSRFFVPSENETEIVSDAEMEDMLYPHPPEEMSPDEMERILEGIEPLPAMVQHKKTQCSSSKMGGKIHGSRKKKTRRNAKSNKKE